MVAEGELDPNIQHCRGCACEMFARDLMMVKMSHQLVHELSAQGWSRPVQLRVDPVHSEGYWELSVKTAENGRRDMVTRAMLDTLTQPITR